MAEKKILSFAVLGAALVALATQAAGTAAEKPLQALTVDFNAFATQQDALVASLQSALSSSKDAVTALKKQFVAAASNGAALSDQQEALVKSLKVDLEDANDVITDLKQQLADATTKAEAVSSTPVVTIDKVKYQVNSGAHGFGSAEEIAKNPEFAKKILSKSGQNVLIKL